MCRYNVSCRCTEGMTCDTEGMTCDTEEMTCDTEGMTCDTGEMKGMTCTQVVPCEGRNITSV